MSTWVDEVMTGAIEDASGRVTDMKCDEVQLAGETMGRVLLRFTVEDLRGDEYEARGRLLLPRSVGHQQERHPAIFHCGYEAPEIFAAKQVCRGRVSATTIQLPLDAVFPNAWSLLRGPKMEFVLAHLLRSLSFVDPGKVVYAGGSAGGYSALLAAAEAFPAAAAIPSVPPVNLAYMGAVTDGNLARLAGSDAPSLGWVQGMSAASAAWRLVFGDDYDAPGWLAHSPVSHVDRITCPVSAFFSRTDPLVPLAQVDEALAQAVNDARPGQLELRPETLSNASSPSIRLLDVLGDRAEVTIVPVPEEMEPMTQADLSMVTDMPPFPVRTSEPRARTWAITIVDEGEPHFMVSHFQHRFEPDFEEFVGRALDNDVAVEQLDEKKLAQLLDRWSAVEWFAQGFHYLDRPEAEQADVARGLRRYCSTSPAHVARFRHLYEALPPTRRTLPVSLVEKLLHG